MKLISVNETKIEHDDVEWSGELSCALGTGLHLAPGLPEVQRNQGAAEMRGVTSFREGVTLSRLREANRRLNQVIPFRTIAATSDALLQKTISGEVSIPTAGEMVASAS
jgi:hypothetical protein